MKKTMTTADFMINPSKDKMALYIHAYLAGRKMSGSVEVALSKLTANFDYAFSLIVSAVSYGLLRRAMVESEKRHLKAVFIKYL